MNTDLGNYRKSYDKEALLEKNASNNPLEQFKNWFHEVDEHYDVGETNAMTLSTIGLDGFPRSRVVLLKEFNDEGFVFYTNYESEKGVAMINNPHVCISFFWPAAERQIIIKGKVEKITERLSDDYFASRPRGSRLGAWVSHQSTVIKDRAVLEDRLKALEQKFDGKEIPRPDFWGGFIVKPLEIEFWQGRPNRLHDRLRYQLKDDLDWTLDRLSP
ncbi:MAG: pyridoxamine 5'-phosphate oxidase [Psychroserpens sp.]|uniref:pyridoxamine 5'-phosphate oxidase n=1 Tax=Psychroserpens sp. TaxID=2020870 RepID=UPI003C76FAAE